MNLILVLVSMLLIAASASGHIEEISAGPYIISFDLNTALKYNASAYYIVEADNTTSATVDIEFDDDCRANILIYKYTEWQYAGTTPCCTASRRLALDNDENVVKYNLSTSMIDGRPGDVVKQTYLRQEDSSILNTIIAEYWPDAMLIDGYNIPVGKTKVEILAIMPEDMSESLLDTIHISLPPDPISPISALGQRSNLSDAKSPSSSSLPGSISGTTGTTRATSTIGPARIDRACLDRYKGEGYTESMVLFMGMCMTPNGDGNADVEERMLTTYSRA